MRWRGRRQSSNVEDQTGGLGLPMGGGGLGMPIGKGGLGCGGLVVVIVLAFVFGLDPMQLIGESSAPQRETSAAVPGQGQGCERSATHAFACTVLADTEDAWNAIFAKLGSDYPEPTLVFYSGLGQSGCGVAQTATGPFYCPSDNKIYLDTSFFDDLDRKLGASGDFADAYVIAHEVGHHVQMLTGVAEDVRRAQARASPDEANALQVRMELQADCYAGVWARSVQRQLEPGDMEEALTAAEAIGDDRLQRRSQGYVGPDSFTHGTSAERMFWLQRGYGTGDPADCDTFTVERL
jgi:predicted metalloprotease